jgi:osmoprotectant transport system ATP-binding protein
VTHDISEALRLGNTIAIMHQGKLEQIGTAAALLQSPANDFVKNFMAARHCEERTIQGNITHEFE